MFGIWQYMNLPTQARLLNIVNATVDRPMSTFSIKLAANVCILSVLSLHLLAGCVSFRGELRLVSSDKRALDVLKVREGVWVGRLQSQGDRDYKGEYIARVFRARNGKFKLNVNLFDPKRTDRIQNTIFDIEVIEAKNGIVLFAYHQVPDKTDLDCMVWFVQGDGRECKVFFAAKQAPKSCGQTERVGARMRDLHSAADIARLKNSE